MGGFPKFKHHNSLEEMDFLVKYQAFQCPQGLDCPFAHIAAIKMSNLKKDKADQCFSEVYANF